MELTEIEPIKNAICIFYSLYLYEAYKSLSRH